MTAKTRQGYQTIAAIGLAILVGRFATDSMPTVTALIMGAIAGVVLYLVVAALTPGSRD